MNEKMFDVVDANIFLKLYGAFGKTLHITKVFATDPNVQTLLKSDAKFDLVISELIMNEAVLGKRKNYKPFKYS